MVDEEKTRQIFEILTLKRLKNNFKFLSPRSDGNLSFNHEKGKEYIKILNLWEKIYMYVKLIYPGNP